MGKYVSHSDFCRLVEETSCLCWVCSMRPPPCPRSMSSTFSSSWSHSIFCKAAAPHQCFFFFLNLHVSGYVGKWEGGGWKDNGIRKFVLSSPQTRYQGLAEFFYQKPQKVSALLPNLCTPDVTRSFTVASSEVLSSLWFPHQVLLLPMQMAAFCFNPLHMTHGTDT